MLKPKRKKFVRTVTALVDADPTYVSIVSAGANGLPFNVVKQENSTMGIKIKPRKIKPCKITDNVIAAKNQVLKNANNRVAKAREVLAEPTVNDRAIIKFFYAKDDFKTEEAVREHLNKSDFEGTVTVTDEDYRFVVSNSEIDNSRIIKQAEVEADQGVIAVVASLRGEPAEDINNDSSNDAATVEGEPEVDTTPEDEDDAKAELLFSADSITEFSADSVTEDDKDSDSTEVTQEATNDTTTQIKSKKALFLDSITAEVAAEHTETEEQKLQKFDFWAAYDDGSSDFMTLLKTGSSDGAAPGFDDTMWLFGQSIRNALANDTAPDTSIKKSSDDFRTVIIGMHNLFSNIVNADIDVVAKADKDKADGLTKWAKSFGKSLVGDRARDTGLVTKAVAQVPAIDTGIFTKALAEALAPLQAEVELVVKTVDKLSSRRQLSKGIDLADATTSEGTNTTPTKKEADPAAIASAQRIAKSVFAAR